MRSNEAREVDIRAGMSERAGAPNPQGTKPIPDPIGA
jgi:hypothetical protein